MRRLTRIILLTLILAVLVFAQSKSNPIPSIKGVDSKNFELILSSERGESVYHFYLNSIDVERNGSERRFWGFVYIDAGNFLLTQFDVKCSDRLYRAIKSKGTLGGVKIDNKDPDAKYFSIPDKSALTVAHQKICGTAL